jgi:hypothetical protein
MNRKNYTIGRGGMTGVGGGFDIDDDEEFKAFCEQLRGYVKHYHNQRITIRVEHHEEDDPSLIKRLGRFWVD